MLQFSKEVSTVESVKFAKNIVDNQGDIVVAASIAKFSSDPGLRDFLLFTGQKVLVEGVSSASRGPATFGGAPRYVSHGAGARLYAVDGREYIDWMMAFGALPLGHGHPKIVETGGESAPKKVLHNAIKAVTADIEEMSFNTAISRMMEFVNEATKAARIDREDAETFVLVLAPFAPHITEELWERLGHTTTLAYEPWPKYDESLLTEDTVDIAVQVLGKLRGIVKVPVDASKDQILAAAKSEPNVQRHLEGKNIVKEIYVPGKLVNLVVK